jgi:hypothetical protein
MRNASFALTTDQVRARTKTVTRRMGWAFLRVGDLLQPIVKGQGLKKGETVERIGGPVRVVSVRRERLSRLLRDDDYAREELRREGLPQLTPAQFVQMFCEANDCRPGAWVTRIEFEYVEEA